MPSGGLLVLAQVVEVDKVDADPINFNLDAGGIAFGKIYAGERRKQINAIWRIAQLYDLISHQKIGRA